LKNTCHIKIKDEEPIEQSPPRRTGNTVYTTQGSEDNKKVTFDDNQTAKMEKLRKLEAPQISRKGQRA
jgi:hypothetical protein